MAANRNEAGYVITAQDFFHELGVGDQAPIKQSVSDARKKISWRAFEFLLNEANQEESIEELWHGHRVRIADGTKLNLPLSDELAQHFAVPSTKEGPGHYPQAWMVTLINSTSILDFSFFKSQKILEQKQSVQLIYLLTHFLAFLNPNDKSLSM
jgi:hypothetical protein